MKVIGARAPLVLCIFTGILLSEAVNHMLTAGAYFSQYPYLTQSFTILNIENISLNLFIMQLHFGIKICAESDYSAQHSRITVCIQEIIKRRFYNKVHSVPF